MDSMWLASGISFTQPCTLLAPTLLPPGLQLGRIESGHVLCHVVVHAVSAAGNQDVLESTQYCDFSWLDSPFEPY